MPPSIDPPSLTTTIVATPHDHERRPARVSTGRGPDGAALVPDLASALPQVSPDGSIYRFPLRGGIEYSTGDPIRPEDYRHGLERSISSNAPPADIFSAIDGADACAEDPPTCDLRESNVTDAEAVTFHLARPDPDFPFKLTLPFAFPVPAGIPVEDQKLVPVPATGPYMVVEASKRGVEGERPGTRSSRMVGHGAARWVRGRDLVDVRGGRRRPPSIGSVPVSLDWMADPAGIGGPGVAPSPQHPDQVVLLPSSVLTLFVGFDVNKPPFDDVRVRRAHELRDRSRPPGRVAR